MAAFICFMKIILPSILFINLCLQIHHISAQPFAESCNNAIGNYSGNSKFGENLNTIKSSITSNVNKYGFFNNTTGDGVDQVNAIGLCRGDIDIESCRSCVHDAAHNLTVLCPHQKEAIVWYDECLFRYSNNSITGIVSTGGYYAANTQNASNVTFFSGELRSFAGELVDQAYNGTFLKFAERKMSDANNQTIYGFMQCTPDLTSGDCMSCLDIISQYLSGCCYNRVGARYLSPSCIFRYETYSFLNGLSNQSPPPSPSPLSSPPSTTTNNTGTSTTIKHKKRSKSKTIIIIVCVIVALLFLTLSVSAFITRRRWQKENTEQKHKDEEKEELKSIGDRETRQFNFALIKAATDNFSTANLLGKGGFGEVYKGILYNGKEIAVKRLSITSSQGEEEFRNEVMLLAKLQHKCLVKLLGFCLEQKERLLVYEFMVNGSLDKFLFDDAKRLRLDWGKRYQIINSIAKGLIYLHEDSRLMIIHRDLKASNILLDEEMNSKISDFGTARLFGWDESEVNTRKIAGTMGYMAPEYAMHGLISVKSDVYSYGVLLLEIITGKRNYSSLNEDRMEDLLSYVYISWREGRAFDLIDPMMTVRSYPLEIILRCIHIALLCVQENVRHRPTMATVVLMLQSLTMPLPLPLEPGYFNNTKSWLSKIQESTSSSNQSNTKLDPAFAHDDPSLNEETDSDLYPR